MLYSRLGSLTTNNILMFAGKVELIQMNHISVVPLYGKLLALLVNIRHGRKDLPGTSTLAYNKHSYITAVKRFIRLAPGLSSVLILLTLKKFPEKFQDMRRSPVKTI